MSTTRYSSPALERIWFRIQYWIRIEANGFLVSFHFTQHSIVAIALQTEWVERNASMIEWMKERKLYKICVTNLIEKHNLYEWYSFFFFLENLNWVICRL